MYQSLEKNPGLNPVLRMHSPDNYIEESAFNRKLVNRIFEIKEVTSPLDLFKTYHGKVRKILKQVLEKKNFKSYITMKIRMYKKYTNRCRV